MKKSAYVILLLLTFSVVGNAKAESLQSETQNSHHGHGGHGKKDGHRRGIGLFHFRHHGKDHAKSHDHSRSHHGGKGHGDKGRSHDSKSNTEQ